MTNEKIWEFLEAYTVVVPVGFAKTKAELLNSVRGVIATTERNLDAISITALQTLSTSIMPLPMPSELTITTSVDGNLN